VSKSGTESRSRIENWVSYYARPSHFTSGGVNQSRLVWANEVSQVLGKQVLIIDAEHGYQSERKFRQLNFLSIKHFGKKRFWMLPLNLKNFNFGKNTVLQLHEGWTISNLYVAALCFVTSTKYIVTPHGVYNPHIVEKMRGGAVRRILETFVLNRAHIVHVFFHDEETHIKSLAKRARVVVAPTGASELLDRFQWEGSGGFALYCGRLDVHHKGLDLLIEAYSIVKPSYDLLIVGPDFNSGKRELSELITKLNLDSKVYLIASQPTEVLEELLRTCNYFVHPSRWESFGRSVLEAVAGGVPVLVTEGMEIAKEPKAQDFLQIAEFSVTSIAMKLEELSSKHFGEDHRCKSVAFIREELNWEKSARSLINSIDALP
jgi:glycosyltransferase involved in cell wall biosynthesis